jgi:hypothetical protein
VRDGMWVHEGRSFKHDDLALLPEISSLSRGVNLGSIRYTRYSYHAGSRITFPGMGNLDRNSIRYFRATRRH